MVENSTFFNLPHSSLKHYRNIHLQPLADMLTHTHTNRSHTTTQSRMTCFLFELCDLLTTSGLSIPRIAAFFYYFPSRTNDKVSSTAASNNTVTFSGPESGFPLCHGQEQHQHKTIATSSFILFFCFAGKTHKVLLHVVCK